MYGQSWKISNIQKATLLEEMPEVLSKENGFDSATISKGHFNVGHMEAACYSSINNLPIY